MRSRVFRFSLALVLLCLAAAQAAWAAEPIRVGVTVSLTGEYAELGRKQLQGMQMWAEDVNARGALLGRKVQIVHYDDHSSPARSARLYERLISQDRVDLLLGPYSSPITLAASRVAERHGFPMVATGAASGSIWSQGFQNIFQIDAPAEDYMDLPLEFAAKSGMKRIALVYEAGEFPREVAKGVRDEAAAHGLEIVFDQEYSGSNVNFGKLANAMRKENPDVVLGGTYFKDSVALVKAARKAGLSPRMFVLTVGPALKKFGDELGGKAENVTGVVAWMRSGKLPMAYDFSYRYKKRYGRNAAVHVAYGYAGGQVLEAAVRLAGSLDKDTIREQLRSLVFTSLLGKYRVDETGKQLAKRTYALQWQNGRRLLVFPERIAESPVQTPFN